MADLNLSLQQTLHDIAQKLGLNKPPVQPPAPVVDPNKPTPGNIPDDAAAKLKSGGGDGTDPNGIVPDNSVTSTKSPLDAFATLWQTDPNKADPNSGSIFNVDMAKLQEAAGKTDFVSSLVTPEIAAKIAGGGEEAVKALVATINSVAQKGYAQSAFASTQIAEKAAEKVLERINASLPQQIKSLSVSDQLRTENPALKHPAIAPLISLIEHSVAQKHPNASATEIKETALSYVKGLVDTLQVKPVENTKKSSEPDWGKFLDMNT